MKNLFPCLAGNRTARARRLRGFMSGLFALTALALLPFATLKAQVSGLGFTAASGTYTEITGGSVLGSGTVDDNTYSGTPIGFTYNFNGAGYTDCVVSANGWLSFTAGTTNYTPISGSGGNGVVSAVGGDLQGNSNGELRYQTLGSAPNRVFVVQWKNWNKYPYGSNTDNYNFQVRLYETSGKAEVIYGSMTATSSLSYQVGLRGATTNDYNNRSVSSSWASSTAGTSNSATCSMTSSCYPASGLTYRWQLPQYDAALVGFAAPVQPFSAGSRTVSATVKNNGAVTLTSFTVNWSVNSVAQTAVNWSGTLAPGASVDVTLGSYTFASGVSYAVSSTVSNPNGQADENTSNDTYAKTMRTGMAAGTYTIGPSGADYPTFAAAISDVSAAGVLGAVTFNVFSATYSEQVNIPFIPGASSTNLVTFQSLTGNPANVTVLAPNSSVYEYPTVFFNGAQWVKFQNMTISAAYSYSVCVKFDGGASNNTVAGNIIQPGASASTSMGVLMWGLTPQTGNSIIGNTFTNCYEGVGVFYSVYNSGLQYGVANNLTIKDNIINGTYYGMYLYPYYGSMDNATIKNNTITSSSSGYYGIYAYPYYGSAANLKIQDNTIAMSNTSGYYGIYAYGYNPNLPSYSGTVGMEITGNTVSTTYTSGYGIYAYYVGNNTKVNNNNVTGFTYNYVYGYSGGRPIGVEVKNNTFANQGTYGLYSGYLDAPVISSNIVSTNLAPTSNYNMYFVGHTGNFSITKNQVYGRVGGYGMYFSSVSGIGTVANNFIQIGSAASASARYGAYLSSCTMNFYHNSINVTGTSGSAYGLYITGGSGNNIRNNNIVQGQSSTTAYGLYFSATSVIANCNNNNIYTNGTAYFGYAGAAQTSLAAWRSAYNFDLNSVNVDPQYTSATNLHTSRAELNGVGTATSVADDIDGQLRSVAPDAGADEFTLAGLDATIRWVGPVRPATAGNNNVVVKIANVRATPIASAFVQYSDGTTTVQQTFNFSPAIQAEGSQNVTFTTPYNLQTLTTFTATILSVNGSTDDDATNNTATITLRPALSGSYTICGTGGNFPDIATALTTLAQGGVSAPVTFNLCAGTYTTPFSLSAIDGASATNRITFQSGTGNASDVTLQPTSVVAPDYNTVAFNNGASFYTLNNLRLVGLSSGTHYMIKFSGNNNNVTVQNCIITEPTVSNTSCYPIYAPTVYTNNLTIQNNQITGGYYGMYLFGNSGQYSDNTKVLNNTVTDMYYMGMYLYYNNNIQVAGNTITRVSRSSFTTTYGIYLNYYKGMLVEKNRIHSLSPVGAASVSNSCYAMYLYNSGNYPTASQVGIVRNNLIYNINLTGTVYGMMHYYQNQNYYCYNNTIALEDNSATPNYTYGMYSYESVTAPFNVEIRNNIISIARGGSGYNVGLYKYAAGTNVIINHNLYRVNGTSGLNYVGSNNGTMYNPLSAWQAANAASGIDANSVSGDPLFTAPATFDYNISYLSPAAYTGYSNPAVVTDDFTGGLRNALYPSMGAYNPPATLRITGNTDFGKVGNTTTRQIVIGNTSAQSAITASFSFTGAASSYRLYYAGTTNPIPTNFTLPASGTLAMDIAFGMPGISGGGSQPATLTFTHNGANTPTSVNITGYYASLTAVDGTVNLLAPGAKFDVGGVLIGGSPKTKGFTAAPDVANLDVPMSFTGYTLAGPDAAFFKVSTLPASINNAIQISVTLDPLGASPGTKTAVLTIFHSGYNGPSVVINIEGKVGKPLLGAPSVVDLPYVAVGQTYSSTYENYALIPLTRAGLVDVNMFQNPTLTGSGAGQMEVVSNNGNYYLKGAYAGGGALVVAGDGQVGNSANWISASVSNPAKVTDVQPLFVVVRMKQQPANNAAPAGSYDAKILFSNGTGVGMSSGDNYVETTIVGQIISDPTKLPFFPLQLDFGRVAVNTTSLAKTFTLRNQSGVAGMVTLTINGVDNQSYHFGNGVRVKTVSLPSDNSPLAVQVYFAPTLDGSKIAAISMSGVVNGTAPLSGTGLAPNAGDLVLLYNGQDINGGTLNFGNVAVGQVGTRTITVVNNNVAPVNISSIGRSGQNATQFSVGDMSPSTTVAGNGGTATFAVNFVPTSTSAPSKSGVITVYNSTGTAKQFTVQGTAVTSGGGTVSVTLTPTTYNYGNASGTQVFTLTNTGTSAVTVSGAGILGSTNFAVINAPSFPLTVAAGGTQTFTVQFSATGTNGQRSGTLLVIVNGVSPYPSSQLSGRVGAGTVEGGNGTGSGKLSGEGTIGELLSLTSCYPNPAVEKSTIGYRLAEVSDVVVRLYSSVGKEVGMFNVGTKQSGEHTFEFVSNGFASGTYYYTIEASGSQVSGEIVIVK